MISSYPGVSLSLWLPDEEILADNLNLRERKYGGIYSEDAIGSLSGIPVISFSTIGDLYGSPVYGFTAYAAIAVAGLITDSLSFNEIVPTFSFGSAFAVYNEPKLYGYLAYGVQSFITDSVLTGELTPTFSFGTATGYYGVGDLYGFLEYGAELGLATDTITTGETSISLSTVVLSGVTYGSSHQYGYIAWQA